MQQQYLPYGGYVNVRNGINSEDMMQSETNSKSKFQDIIVPTP